MGSSVRCSALSRRPLAGGQSGGQMGASRAACHARRRRSSPPAGSYAKRLPLSPPAHRCWRCSLEMRPVEAVHAESKCLRVQQALFALKPPAHSTCGSEETAWAPLSSSRTGRRRQHGQRRLWGSRRRRAPDVAAARAVADLGWALAEAASCSSAQWSIPQCFHAFWPRGRARGARGTAHAPASRSGCQPSLRCAACWAGRRRA